MKRQTHFIQLIELAFTKAVMDLQSEAGRTYLGYAWWMLEPLMHMGIYYLVFGVVFNAGGEGFVLFLLVSVTHWLWFSKSVANATASIMLGKGLMTHIDIPKVFFPLVVVIHDFIKQLPVFALLLMFMLFYGVSAKAAWLAWPAIVVVEFMMILTFAIVTAAIIPFFPDLNILVMTGLQFLMFVSGVFFSEEMVPENLKGIFFLNPMARLLHMIRQLLIHGNWPDWIMLGELVCYLAVALATVVWIVGRIDHIYPRLVSE
ncbi:MAG: ABC transporter permease [Gammaproteobacteria bacterium]